MPSLRAWFVRAGKDDEYDDLSFEQGVVAIGWRSVKDLTDATSRAAVAEQVRAAYPGLSKRALESYVVQLNVFRNEMQAGDIVILLRGTAPEIGLGQISGDYGYRPGATARHVRPTEWIHRSLRRSEVPELSDPPALSVVYLVASKSALAELEKLTGAPAPSEAGHPPSGLTPEISSLATSAAYENLRQNLQYARNLTSAGSHLEKLKVSLFEVTDVYRAAWVQAVAAIDHWVHQEICDRMVRLAADPAARRPGAYARFQLPLELVEKVQTGQLALPDAVNQSVKASLAYKTYQNPEKLKEGLAHVADVSNLWQRVAMVLSEQTTVAVTGQQVQARLKNIVNRRNRIAHEYDEDAANPPAKRGIDAETTMQTIEWLDELAVALLVVLDQ